MSRAIIHLLVFSTLYSINVPRLSSANPPAAPHGNRPADTLQHEGMNRYYSVHVPTTYDQSKKIPLVIALHGGGGSGQQFEAQSGLSAKADLEGFIVVYPDGLQNPGLLRLRTWNAGACCGQSASTMQTDDVGFISKLIDKLSATYRIDPKRVYATGHSNGAMLCYRLACELPGKLAAIAANAGTMQVQTVCQPKRVIPILHIHSELDRNVPSVGGVGSRSINRQWNSSVDSTLGVFSKLAGCTTPKKTIQKTENYTFFRWLGCSENSDIQYYMTSDGGHAWPGGHKGARRIGDSPSQAFVANDLIWRFFKDHSLP